MRITRRNRIVAFARIVGPVSSHAAKLLIGRDLAEQVGQHRGIANTTAGDFDRTDLKRFRIYSDMYLAPEPSLGAAMLARVPLPFTLSFDASAIDQQGAVALPNPCRGWRRTGFVVAGTECCSPGQTSPARQASANWPQTRSSAVGANQTTL